VRRTVPPSAEIQQRIDELLASGVPAGDAQGALSELARLGAKLIIQRAVEEEFDAFLGRERYERRPDALPGKRNGWRARHLQTNEGELEIEIPQMREAAETFVSKLFPRESKRLLTTEPLRAMVVGAFVRGLSMRDVESLCEEAGLGHVSASTASRICQQLRDRYRAFRERDLSGIELVALYLDAIYLPVRPTGAKEGVLCAWGIDKDGKRVLLDVCLGMRESEEDWLALGRGLVSRGLSCPLMVVCDGAPGLNNAIDELWPRADRQRCTVHRLRNLLAKASRRAAGGGARSLLAGARRGRGPSGRRAATARTDRLALGPGLRLRRRLPGRRPARALRASALPAQAPPALAQHQPARTLARRGAPAHQSDRPLPRRDQLPLALLGRARPDHHPLQQHHLHRP
jgi:putative transposase